MLSKFISQIHKIHKSHNITTLPPPIRVPMSAMPRVLTYIDIRKPLVIKQDITSLKMTTYNSILIEGHINTHEENFKLLEYSPK